jgi:hypothetical protein
MIVRACVGLAALLAASDAGAVAYKLVDLGVPGGFDTSNVRAVASNGLAVSEYDNSATAARAAGLFSTTPSLISGQGVPSAVSGRGVNASGIIAGSAGTSALLLGSGGITTLNPANGYQAAGAFGINNGGTAVGYSYNGSAVQPSGSLFVPNFDSAQQAIATVWAPNGSNTTLTPLNLTAGSAAVAVNDAGVVAGLSFFGSTLADSRAVKWVNGTVRQLSNVGARVRGINALGDVFGLQSGSGAVIWNADNSTTVLPSAGGTTPSATLGLNNRGQAVGSGTASDGQGGTVNNALIWERANGQWTGDLLANRVANLGGYQLSAGYTIDDYGRIFAQATAPGGASRSVLLLPSPVSATAGLGASWTPDAGMGAQSLEPEAAHASMASALLDLAGGGCGFAQGSPITAGSFSAAPSPRALSLVAQGDVSLTRLNARGNTSCYYSVGFGAQTFNITAPDGQTLDYFGFEWSSIDAYNRIRFYDGLNGTGNLISLAGYGTELNGAALMAAWGLANDSNGRAPDAFVEFRFPIEFVRSIVFESDNAAFEFDNLRLGFRTTGGSNLVAADLGLNIVATPAPGGMIAGLLALAALAVRRRRG